MKNWRTTTAGLLLAIGIGLSGSSEPISKFIGLVAAAIGGLMLAILAKDAKTE